MHDQRTLVERLETADATELAKLVAEPTVEEQKVLRTYLGNARYQRLHSLALRRGMMRSARAAKAKGNVVVIPEMLGSQLSTVDANGKVERIWLSPRRIVAGHLARLTLDTAGLSELDPSYTVQASGIMKRYYGELILSLAENWNVHAFWYDWRKDLSIAAAQLQARINSWFTADEPVHIVAHSAGGLVARAYIAKYAENWARGGRLIMLGTPNHGLHAALQGITGQLDIIRWVDLLDTQHDSLDFRTIVHSFPSLYQLLPSPFELPEMEKLYHAETYGADLKVSQLHLDRAYKFHELLRNVVDPERMVYIAGDNQPTFVGIRLDRLQMRRPEDVHKVYHVGLDGDGSVDHRLGLLKTDTGQSIPTYYVEAVHGELQAHSGVLSALDTLLIESLQGEDWRTLGERSGLQCEPGREKQHNGRKLVQSEKKARESLEQVWQYHQDQLETLVRRVHIRSGEPVERAYITADERAIEEILARGFLTGWQEGDQVSKQGAPFEPPSIRSTLFTATLRCLTRCQPLAHQ